MCRSVRKTLSHADENYGNISFQPRLNSVFATKKMRKRIMGEKGQMSNPAMLNF